MASVSDMDAPGASAYDVQVNDDNAADSRRTRRVLVVCAGNICRSPTAEAVIRLRGSVHPSVDLEAARAEPTTGTSANVLIPPWPGSRRSVATTSPSTG